jgi:glycosyltransferase involved in cell wall biosynthesis
MISIIIPVYNQADKLGKCLESIKRQTFDNYEIIVVNDGSRDNAGAVAEKYKQLFGLKFTYIDQENQGPCAARNRGAAAAKGELLIFCDADIEMKPEMLAKMKETLALHSEASYAYSSFYWDWKLFKLWPFDAEKLKKMPYITTTSLMRREHFPSFDVKIKKFNDWDLWLTMLEQGHIGIWIDEPLFKVNAGGFQTMSSWVPSFAYKLLPFLPSVKKYKRAMAIIKDKHKL